MTFLELVRKIGDELAARKPNIGIGIFYESGIKNMKDELVSLWNELSRITKEEIVKANGGVAIDKQKLSDKYVKLLFLLETLQLENSAEANLQEHLRKAILKLREEQIDEVTNRNIYIARLELEKSTLETEKRGWDTERTSLTTENTALRGRNLSLETESAGLKAEKESWTREKEEKRAIITNLEFQISTLRGESASDTISKSGQISTLIVENSSLKADKAAKDSTILSLNSQNSQLRMDVAALMSKTETQTTDITRLTGSLSEKTGTLAIINTLLSEKSAQALKYEGEKDKKNEALEQKTALATRLTDSNHALEIEIIKLNSMVQKLNLIMECSQVVVRQDSLPSIEPVTKLKHALSFFSEPKDEKPNKQVQVMPQAHKFTMS